MTFFPKLLMFVCYFVPILSFSTAISAEIEDVRLIKDFEIGESVSHAIKYDGNIYFLMGNSRANTFSLWKTDGTDKHTILIKKIEGETVWNNNILTQVNSPSLPFEEQQKPILIEGDFYFLTVDLNSTPRIFCLWRSDGTGEGTRKVTETPQDCSAMSGAIEMNDILYFLDPYCLWRSDGSAAGTWKITGNFTNARSHIVYNNKLYFTAYNENKGFELWRSDGTSQGTRLFLDLNKVPGSFCYTSKCDSSSAPWDYVVFNGELFFTAFNPTYGRELWKTDGAAAWLVKDIYPGEKSGMSSDPFITLFHDRLFFNAIDDLHGTEVWISDGTAEGTFMLKDIFPGKEDGTRFDFLGKTDNYLYFQGKNSHGMFLWKTDGTSTGTVPIKAFGENINHLSPSPFTIKNLNENFYFQATSQDGNQFWTTDGTVKGTVKLRNNIDSGYQSENNAATFNDKLYMSARDENYDDLKDTELWITDGTIPGTRLYKDIFSGNGIMDSSFPSRFMVLNNSLLFFANTEREYVYEGNATYLYYRTGLFTPILREITYPWLSTLLLRDRP